MRNDRFKRGSAVYTCDVCGRRTRHTGAQSLGSKLCPQCYELAGIENSISDEPASAADYRGVAFEYLAEIAAKGGDVTGWATLVADLGAADDAANGASDDDGGAR